jgi:hypothetical protein
MIINKGLGAGRAGCAVCNVDGFVRTDGRPVWRITVFLFEHCSTFVCIWQLSSNYGLTKAQKIHRTNYRQTVQLITFFIYI